MLITIIECKCLKFNNFSITSDQNIEVEKLSAGKLELKLRDAVHENRTIPVIIGASVQCVKT